MGRESIYKTLNVSYLLHKSSLEDIIDELVAARPYILSEQKMSDAFRVRLGGNSLLAEITRRLADRGKDKDFSLVRLPSKTIGLREVMDWSFIPFDMLQIKDVLPTMNKAVEVIPELNGKMVINITDITNAHGEISGIPKFHERVVRDFLSRSYYTSSSSVWVSPTFVRYAAKVYNMTIGGQISRNFNLQPIDQMFIQTVLCMYFVAKCTTQDITPAFMRAHGGYMRVASGNDLIQISAFVEDVVGKKAPGTLLDVLAIIDAYKLNQLMSGDSSRLTLAVLNQLFSKLFTDNQMSAISLEYPPYFVFMVLNALSGGHSGLTRAMRDRNLMKDGNDEFKTAITSPAFYNIP